MRRTILENTSPLVKALCLFSIMLVCSIVCILVYTILGHGTDISSLRYTQALQSIGIFVVPCLIGAALWSQHPMQWLRLTKMPSWTSIGLTIALIICAIPFINLLHHYNQQITLPEWLSTVEEWMKYNEENANNILHQFLASTRYCDLFLNLFVMAFLPGLSEEILFRGTLQPLLGEQKNASIAIWCSAFLFSAIHMQFYGFIPRLLMGAALGYMAVWSGSLWLPIIGHAINNAIAVVSYFICQRLGADSSVIDSFGTQDTLWAGLLSCIVISILIYALRRSLTMSNASSRNASGN